MRTVEVKGQNIIWQYDWDTSDICRLKKKDIWLHVLVCCILGENAHRGAALGALLAANTVNVGSSAPQRWKDGLHSAKLEVEVIVQQKL